MVKGRQVAERVKKHFLKFDGAHISKMDVVRRQLDTAIDLWFHEGDAVSIHTLAMSASSIFLPIAKAKGIPGGALDDSHIVETRKQFFAGVVSFYHNFFKHASSDAEETAPFKEGVNGPVLMQAVASYGHLTGGVLTPQMKAYHWRYIAEHLTEYKASYEGLPETEENLAALSKLTRLDYWKQTEAEWRPSEFAAPKLIS